jgi:peroxiredoxin
MVIGEVLNRIVASGCLALAVGGCSQNGGASGASTEKKTAGSQAAPADDKRGPDRSPPSSVPAAEVAAVPSGKEAPSSDSTAGASASLRKSGEATVEPAAEAAKTEGIELASARAAVPLDESQGAELTMPRVSLTKAHAETCRVQVGDDFPDLSLVALNGHEQSLARLMGKTFTVVLFWNGSKPTALEELRDLGPDVLDRFSGNGVAVIGINTGDEPQLASELVKQAGARFPQLCDPQGEAFKQVATTKVPRTFLVDPSGKILWFDLEYSSTTRRELVQAIRYLLTHH